MHGNLTRWIKHSAGVHFAEELSGADADVFALVTGIHEDNLNGASDRSTETSYCPSSIPKSELPSNTPPAYTDEKLILATEEEFYLRKFQGRFGKYSNVVRKDTSVIKHITRLPRSTGAPHQVRQYKRGRPPVRASIFDQCYSETNPAILNARFRSIRLSPLPWKLQLLLIKRLRSCLYISKSRFLWMITLEKRDCSTARSTSYLVS